MDGVAVAIIGNKGGDNGLSCDAGGSLHIVTVNNLTLSQKLALRKLLIDCFCHGASAFSILVRVKH